MKRHYKKTVRRRSSKAAKANTALDEELLIPMKCEQARRDCLLETLHFSLRSTVVRDRRLKEDFHHFVDRLKKAGSVYPGLYLDEPERDYLTAVSKQCRAKELDVTSVSLHNLMLIAVIKPFKFLVYTQLDQDPAEEPRLHLEPGPGREHSFNMPADDQLDFLFDHYPELAAFFVERTQALPEGALEEKLAVLEQKRPDHPLVIHKARVLEWITRLRGVSSDAPKA